MGLIGIGGQGRIHLRNCLRLKKAKLIGVADISETSLKFAKKLGIRNVYKNYDDLLSNQQIDAVIISLPNFLHFESVTKAAEAGKDIFLEKPLARNVAEGRKILSNVKRNGVKLMLGYNMRFTTTLRKLHEKIADGFFGEVEIVQATNVSHGPFTPKGGIKTLRSVPSWWFNKDLAGGGALLDLGSHLINLLSWYFGEVKNVESYLGYKFNMELEDSAICILKFRTGPLATINVGWFSKDLIQSIQICGTAKNLSMHLSPPSISHLIFRDIRRKLGIFKYDSYYTELKYFVECLWNDASPSPSGEEGLSDLQVISMAYKHSHNLA